VSKSEDQLPDDAVLMAYIEACEKPPKLRDIARHFQLSPAHRPALRARLHELATRQATEFSKDRDQADLPEIVLIDIIGGHCGYRWPDSRRPAAHRNIAG
jgi:hypothetical protein